MPLNQFSDGIHLLDNDHDEPDEGHLKQIYNEQLALPEEEKKEAKLSNRRPQSFASKVE